MTPENIIWKSFLGDSKPVDFDANRYINWRFFWDYSGGNVYENMCHQLSFWYKVMDLKIPRRSPWSAAFTFGRTAAKSGHDERQHGA
jgi:hypothetical protein